MLFNFINLNTIFLYHSFIYILLIFILLNLLKATQNHRNMTFSNYVTFL